MLYNVLGITLFILVCMFVVLTLMRASAWLQRVLKRIEEPPSSGTVNVTIEEMYVEQKERGGNGN